MDADALHLDARAEKLAGDERHALIVIQFPKPFVDDVVEWNIIESPSILLRKPP